MKFKDLVLPGDQRWAKSQYYDWLEENRDSDHEEEARLLTHILTKNGERVRTNSWSASSAGQCRRRQEFVYLGVKGTPPTITALNIFVNGDYVHLRHQVAGLMTGYLTDVEVPVEIKSMNVKGTVDGICSDGQVIDYKSMNTNQFHKMTFAKEDHQRQLHAYMRATGTRHSRILYEDKNNQDIKEYEVSWDQQVDDWNVSDWKDMQHDMDNHQLSKPLPPGDPMCTYCPFQRICRDTTWEDVAK